MTMILPTVLCASVMAQGVPLMFADAPGPDPASASHQTPSTTRSGTIYPGQTRKVAGEVGFGLGIAIPHAGLSVGPELLLEGGLRIRLGNFGAFVVGIRGGYQRLTDKGTGDLPCVDGEPTPCIDTDPPTYDWNVVVHTGRLGLPIGVRFRPSDRRFVPYLTIAPTLFMMTAKTTSFDLVNTQYSSKFGVAANLGAEVRLGPGGMFLELSYQWAGIDYRTTGDANVGAVLLALGYRFAL